MLNINQLAVRKIHNKHHMKHVENITRSEANKEAKPIGIKITPMEINIETT